MAVTLISHRNNSAAAALAAASTAQSTADSAASAASTAQSTADSAASTASSAASTASSASSLASGLATNASKVGVAFGYATASKTGTGSQQTQNLSMPSGITVSNNKRYGFAGSFNIRKTSDHSILRSQELSGCELNYVGDAWVLSSPGNYEPTVADAGDIASYITAGPQLGFDGGTLLFGWTGVADAQFDVECDLTIKDLGASSPA